MSQDDNLDAAGSKEIIYDCEISPLMRQIIAICKRENIPFHAGFALDYDVACTTHIQPRRDDMPPDDMENFDVWCENYETIFDALPGPPPVMLTTRSAHGQITACEVIS